MATFAKSFCLLRRVKSRSAAEHLAIQLLRGTALLVARVNLIYVD